MANGHGGARPGSGRKTWTPEQRKALSEKMRARHAAANPARAAVSGPTVPAQPRRAAFNYEALVELVRMSRERASRARSRPRTEDWNPFRMETEHRFLFPERAMPAKGRNIRMAQDDALTSNNQFAFNAWMAGGLLGNAVSEGLVFLGYPVLSELAQRPEYRLFGEIQAEEMTRKWIEFRGTDDESTKEKDKPKDRNPDDEQREQQRNRNGEQPRSDSRNKEIETKIKELRQYIDEDLKLKSVYKECVIQDRFFGISHPYIDLHGVDLENQRDSEIRTSIGGGRDGISRQKLTKGCLRGFRVIEPLWAYPTTYNAQNPLMPTWYNPQVWYVMGTEIHASRLLSFIGRPVPDILKPAYAFGGLSMSQMAQPYVDIWLRTRESVGEIIHAFSVMVLMTDLSTTTMPGGAGGGAGDILARLALFNEFRDNQGVFAVNKNTEDFKNVSAPISGLDELQAQSQEHLFAIGRIPAVKFAGIQPKGLNATSEGELRAFYDTIHGYQEHFRPQLTTMIDIAQISLWGERDRDITYDFLSLHELTDKEKAEVRKMDAETDQIRTDSGIVSQEDVRRKVVADPDSGFHGLDPEDVPDLLEEEMQGLIPPGAGKGLEAELEEGGGKPVGEHEEEGAEDIITPNFDRKGRGGASDAVLPFADPALAAAARRDRLNYLDGVAEVIETEDVDQWNADYDPDHDCIRVQGKVEKKPLAERVNIVLHEAGHRGQFVVDKAAFRAFKAAGLVRKDLFEAIANRTHIHDFERTGRVYDMAGEIFAESYSRACLGMPLPAPLLAFWRQRFRQGARDEFVESKHPRDPEGKFTSGGGSSGGGKSPPAATTPSGAPESGAFNGQWISDPDPKKAFEINAKKVLGSPAKKHIHYRRYVLKLVSMAQASGDAVAYAALKEKLASALMMAAENLVSKGKSAESNEVLSQMAKLGLKPPAGLGGPPPAPAPTEKPAPAPPPPAPKPAAAPPPPSPAPKPSFPPPTEAELEKAKKNVALKLEYLNVPNAPNTPAVQALVNGFNQKYAGKTLTDQPALIQKVNDFKQLQQNVASIAGEESKKALAAQAEAAAKQEAANKAAAEKLKEAQSAAKAKTKQYMKELGISETEASGFEALVNMLGGGNDVVETFKKQKAEAEKYGYPITGFQAALIKNYTNGGYGAVNAALRSGSWTAQQHVYARLVNQALEKMPKFEGTVKRGTHLSPEQIAKYKPGHVLQEHAFTSTGDGYKFSGNVNYTIKAIGKRAAKVQKLSSHSAESEVLFKANTYFIVHSVKNVGGVTHIEMEEIEGLHE